MTTVEAPQRTTWQRWRVTVLILLALVLFGFGRFVAQQLGWIANGSLDGEQVANSVEAYYLQQASAKITVECPAEIPLQKNKISDCTATNAQGATTNVSVTVVDLDGHYTFQISDYAFLYPSG